MSIREALLSAPMVNDVPGLRLLRVGDGWDLVRTSADIGFLALAHLRATGTAIGPVLYDGPNERLYYAVGTSTAESWSDLPVRHLSTNSWLVAPGLDQIDDWLGGWCELPDDDTLTDGDALHAALRHLSVGAALEEVGRRVSEQSCATGNRADLRLMRLRDRRGGRHPSSPP